MNPPPIPPASRRVRLAYLVSHPIQYQAPLLRRIAQEPDIDLTVFFGSDFSTRGYKDQGFGVEVAWDTPLTEGYKHHFLHSIHDPGTVSATTPFSRGIYRALRNPDGAPAFDALWVHGYASLNSLQGILAANLLGIPVLLRAEPWLGDRPRSLLKRTLKHLLLAELKPFIAATLPIGTLNARYWRHYFGKSIPQFLMPYAVDNAFFRRRALEAAPLTPTLRKILNLSPHRPVILFASKLQHRKHCDHLIEAYAALLKHWPQPQGAPPRHLGIVGQGDQPGAPSSSTVVSSVRVGSGEAGAATNPGETSFPGAPSGPLHGTGGIPHPPAVDTRPHLVIVGEGDQRRALETQVNHLGLDADIAFAGFQNQTELPGFLALADVFVLPSRHEPWGLIVNEAMAADTAVIVSDEVGAHPDLVTHGVEGAVFPATNVPALTDALRQVFATPETATRMGEQALHRIATWSFSQDIEGLRHALAYTTRGLRPERLSLTERDKADSALRAPAS